MSLTPQHISYESIKQFYKNLMDANLLTNQALAEYLAKNYKSKISQDSQSDPLNINKAMMHAFNELANDPIKNFHNNIDLLKNYAELFTNVWSRSYDNKVAPLFVPDPKDKRFADESWSNIPMFDFYRQAYQLNSTWLMNTVSQLQTLPPKEFNKINFYTKLMIDSMSPSNFVATNPEVIKTAFETNSESLLKGAKNFSKDLLKSTNMLTIPTTNAEDFEIGKTIATTPGKVIFQNDLMQLIQYEPTTEKVYATPLLIMPAWINKYYILDLQAKNSFVKWLVSKGYTVFMISWVNPDEKYSDKEFFDYMELGPIAAIEEVQKITKSKEVNFVGYCLGGTLLATTVAYLKAKKTNPFPIKSLSFLAVLVDFEQAGDLGIFIDEEQISALENRMNKTGYLDGSEMAKTFTMIRANDMIWSFYVNNYLLGKDPFPFDILYWNSDATRLPAKMHSFYLRNMYLNNLLAKPGGIKFKNVDIDLRKNDLPTYILATRQDHIVPWESAYKATQLYSGKQRFVLSGSGHVAGVVNHPDNNKYNYWTNDKLVSITNEWLESATDNPGSWWVDWDKWCSPLSGANVPARKIDAKHVIQSAPGDYVKLRII